MKGFLALAAVAEAATGVALIVAPLLVVRLLFGAELTGSCDPGSARDRQLCCMPCSRCFWRELGSGRNRLI